MVVPIVVRTFTSILLSSPARTIPVLCDAFQVTATLHTWTLVNDLVDCLTAHRVCLVPYDSDANHEPCCKQGHRAHWLLAHGFLKETNSSDDHRNDLVLVQHGKSKLLAAFSLVDLFQSNGQLNEADPKRRDPADYRLANDGSLRDSLSCLFISIDAMPDSTPVTSAD